MGPAVRTIERDRHEIENRAGEANSAAFRFILSVDRTRNNYSARKLLGAELADDFDVLAGQVADAVHIAARQSRFFHQRAPHA